MRAAVTGRALVRKVTVGAGRDREKQFELVLVCRDVEDVDALVELVLGEVTFSVRERPRRLRAAS